MSRLHELQAESSRIVLANHIEPKNDLLRERERGSFSSEQLSILMNGGVENLKKKIRLATELEETAWGNKARRHFLSREEEYVAGLRGGIGERYIGTE